MSSNCKTNLLSNTIILAVIVAAIFLINVSLKLKLAISGIFVAIIVVNIILIFKHCPKKKVSESFKDSSNFNDRFFYDNLVLEPKGDSTWRHPPSNLPLLDPNQIYTPQGTPTNLDPKNNVANGYNQVGPSVDGLADSPKSLFTFSYNQCRPECCPSTYSCDRGCICTNEQQRKFINQRGIVNMPKDTQREY